MLGKPYDVKPLWADLSSAGPRIGVSNFEVQFGDVEMATIWKSDYRVRVHRFRNGNHTNERTSPVSLVFARQKKSKNKHCKLINSNLI